MVLSAWPNFSVFLCFADTNLIWAIALYSYDLSANEVAALYEDSLAALAGQAGAEEK